MALDNIFELGASGVAAAVQRDGFVVVRNALSAAELDAVRDALEPHFEAAHCGHEDFMGRRTKRFGALISKTNAVFPLILHRAVLAVADAVLLRHCARYHIHYTGTMRLEPGESAQNLHRDTGIFPFANPCPPLTVATMWALSDFTNENGGTRLVPGSHHWPEDREPRPDEVVATEMPAGSVLIYTGNTLHGGGDNTSTAPRTGLAIHYGMGWLRQEENQFLAVSSEQARTLPDDILKLMGYALGTKNLGFVDHVDPLQYLRGERDPANSDLSAPEFLERHAAVKLLHVAEAD